MIIYVEVVRLLGYSQDFPGSGPRNQYRNMLIFVEVGQACVGAVAVGWQRILRIVGFPGVQLGRGHSLVG